MLNESTRPGRLPANIGEIMADTTTKTETVTEASAKVTKPKTGKQIAAQFTEAEIAHIREARFALRLDKDTDVVKEAVNRLLADIPFPQA